MVRASKTVGPILVVALMLVLDLSAGASAIVSVEDDSIHDTNYESEVITSKTELEIPELKEEDMPMV